MKIGNIEIKNGLFLAPMAGVTDRAFRHMCKKYGAGATVTEMVSGKAICYGDKKTALLATIYDDDRPCGLQLFGSEPDILARAAVSVLEKFEPDWIDLNMGCPAPKIVGNGEGSALLKDPSLIGRIVKAVSSELCGKVPLTVKIRSGFDKAHINASEVAKTAEQNGADAIFVHARTREQMYAPSADIEIIKTVKQAVSIPVIGNGDIDSAESAQKMLSCTGCDGIMVGRASLGNPYIFDELCHMFSGLAYKQPDSFRKLCDAKEHISLLIEDKGEFIGVREARKHVAWYIRGVEGAAALRNRANLALTKDEMLSLIDEAFGGTS